MKTVTVFILNGVVSSRFDDQMLPSGATVVGFFTDNGNAVAAKDGSRLDEQIYKSARESAFVREHRNDDDTCFMQLFPEKILSNRAEYEVSPYGRKLLRKAAKFIDIVELRDSMQSTRTIASTLSEVRQTNPEYDSDMVKFCVRLILETYSDRIRPLSTLAAAEKRIKDWTSVETSVPAPRRGRRNNGCLTW